MCVYPSPYTLVSQILFILLYPIPLYPNFLVGKPPIPPPSCIGFPFVPLRTLCTPSPCTPSLCTPFSLFPFLLYLFLPRTRIIPLQFQGDLNTQMMDTTPCIPCAHLPCTNGSLSQSHLEPHPLVLSGRFGCTR